MAGARKFEVDQQAAFWSDMGNLYYRMRDYDNTRRCWTKVAETRPEDPRLRQTVFELAVEFQFVATIAYCDLLIGMALAMAIASYLSTFVSQTSRDFRFTL